MPNVYPAVYIAVAVALAGLWWLSFRHPPSARLYQFLEYAGRPLLNLAQMGVLVLLTLEHPLWAGGLLLLHLVHFYPLGNFNAGRRLRYQHRNMYRVLRASLPENPIEHFLEQLEENLRETELNDQQRREIRNYLASVTVDQLALARSLSRRDSFGEVSECALILRYFGISTSEGLAAKVAEWEQEGVSGGFLLDLALTRGVGVTLEEHDRDVLGLGDLDRPGNGEPERPVQ